MGAQEDREDPLSILGQVSPPDPDVLERARDALWSVVAQEMLALRPETGKAGNTTAQAPGDRHREA